MKFEIDKDQLLKSVNIADSVVSSKNVNSILSNCLFNFYKDRIDIISTDNEIGIRTSIESICDENFSMTTNGKVLSQILKELPKGSIVMSVDDSYSISIKSKSKEMKGNLTLVGTPKGDFPDLPEFSYDYSVEIDQVVLKNMIKKVLYAAAVDSIKPVFNGVYLVFENGKFLTAVASDSRRLSLVRNKIDKEVEIKEGVIIPLKTITEVYKLLSSGLCSFSIKENRCFFKIGNTDIVSRIIEGQFPNYNQVIPKDFISFSIIDTKRFMEALKRSMILTKEPTYKIVMKFSKDQLVMESRIPDVGESQEIVDIDYTGNDLAIGVNSQYLLDSLKEIESLSFKISLTGNLSPITITPENSTDQVSVIMPIQVKNTD